MADSITFVVVPSPLSLEHTIEFKTFGGSMTITCPRRPSMLRRTVASLLADELQEFVPASRGQKDDPHG